MCLNYYFVKSLGGYMHSAWIVVYFIAPACSKQYINQFLFNCVNCSASIIRRMESHVGKLEDEAVKRKERLKALRSRQQDKGDEPAEKKTADESNVLPG